MKKEILSLNMSRSLHLFFLVFVVSVLFHAHDVNATTYVTFNDGRLYVFPDTCLQLMTQEEGRISFTAQDGTVYSYPLASIASIDEQFSKELPTFTSFKFNNKYNYQVISDAVGTITDDMVNVTVAGIGKRLTSSFTLSDENARAYVDGKEQESKVSRLRFDNNRTYVVGYPGDMILTAQPSGKYAMLPFGRTYTVNVDYLTDHSTSVPRIDINTVGGVNITSKIEYVDAEIIIDGAGVFPSMTDSVKIRGRGNTTTWSSNPDSKNPYRLKFASKVKPLGLTKGKNWVLLANKAKGSMMTNAIGMKAASLIGTPAVNHMIPVDLYINGTYKGSYNFTEKVGLSNNSVDLEDETTAVLLELDKYYDEAETQKFKTLSNSIPVNIKHPKFDEDSTLLTMTLIKNRFNQFVTCVLTGNDFSKYVDMDYLARYLMANEIILNTEIIHPKSLFCYNANLLDDSSKFCFGPVWDLDWAYGYNTTNATYYVHNATADFYNWPLAQRYFIRGLRYGADTGQRLFSLWKDFMGDKLDELCEFCQDYYRYAAPSFANNKAAGLDNTNYAAQAVQAAQWLRQRANYIYEKVKAECVFAGDVDGDGKISIADVTLLINYLLSGDVDSINMDNSDMDGDGDIDINDVTSLINNLLSEN